MAETPRRFFVGHSPVRKKILLCASTSSSNVGSIAHAPGTLAMLEKYVPEADVFVWPSRPLTKPIFKMLQARFPRMTVVDGDITSNGQETSNTDLGSAIEEADFVLHGSAGGFSSASKLDSVHNRTGKPYGIYGITYEGEGNSILRNAKFAYFRDSVSVGQMKKEIGDFTKVDFAPDTAFAIDLFDNASAIKFLREHDLEEGKFVCAIPKYRITPRWKIAGKPAPEGRDKKNWQYSMSMKDHDHKPLRQAIVSIVKNTDLKVLIVPEDKSQMELGKEMLLDPLPFDVRNRVVLRENFWLTDEAVSTFLRSVGLFSLEMHCPIMCIGQGVPAIVCRFKEQTTKGFMWKDIGLEDWLFDMDEDSMHPLIPQTVLDMCVNRSESLEKVACARNLVRETMKKRMNVLRRELGLSTI